MAGSMMRRAAVFALVVAAGDAFSVLNPARALSWGRVWTVPWWWFLRARGGVASENKRDGI
jgi:hypothetical protein